MCCADLVPRLTRVLGPQRKGTRCHSAKSLRHPARRLSPTVLTTTPPSPNLRPLFLGVLIEPLHISLLVGFLFSFVLCPRLNCVHFPSCPKQPLPTCTPRRRDMFAAVARKEARSPALRNLLTRQTQTPLVCVIAYPHPFFLQKLTRPSPVSRD